MSSTKDPNLNILYVDNNDDYLVAWLLLFL